MRNGFDAGNVSLSMWLQLPGSVVLTCLSVLYCCFCFFLRLRAREREGSYMCIRKSGMHLYFTRGK